LAPAWPSCIAILASVLMIYPLLWMLVSSFRPNELIFREPGLILDSIHLENYTVGWTALTNPFGHYMLNSAIVVLGCIFGNVVSCSLAAYARPAEVHVQERVLRHHAAHHHVAQPRRDRAAVRDVLEAADLPDGQFLIGRG
jgi:ABC-type spermidine/putrescine transport system permease subunit II